MTVVVIVLVVAGISLAVLKRTGKQPSAQAQAIAQPAANKIRALGAGSAGLLNQVRSRFDRSAADSTFKDWIGTLVQALPGDGADAFQNWIDGLGPNELRTFRKQLEAFCDTLEIAPDWLHNDAISDRPALRRSLEETVGLYALAYARGAEQHAAIARTHAFQRWLSAPNRLDNRTFGATLFTALVERGIVTPPAEILLAPERTRRAYAHQAIRDAAARDPQGFDNVLDAVLNRSAQPATREPEAAEPPPAEPTPEPTGATNKRRPRVAQDDGAPA